VPVPFGQGTAPFEVLFGPVEASGAESYEPAQIVGLGEHLGAGSRLGGPQRPVGRHHGVAMTTGVRVDQGQGFEQGEPVRSPGVIDRRPQAQRPTHQTQGFVGPTFATQRVRFDTQPLLHQLRRFVGRERTLRPSQVLAGGTGGAGHHLGLGQYEMQAILSFR